jgi:hypothetical protein
MTDWRFRAAFERDTINGRSARLQRYTCCGAIESGGTSLASTAAAAGFSGSSARAEQGCDSGPHVWKSDDARVLHGLVPFRSPQSLRDEKQQSEWKETQEIVALDAELGQQSYQAGGRSRDSRSCRSLHDGWHVHRSHHAGRRSGCRALRQADRTWLCGARPQHPVRVPWPLCPNGRSPCPHSFSGIQPGQLDPDNLLAVPLAEAGAEIVRFVGPETILVRRRSLTSLCRT